MNSSRYACGILIGLLIAGCGAKEPIERPAQPKPGIATPSLKKGDAPPGNAKNLTLPQARAMLAEGIKKRYVGAFESCQRVLFIKGCYYFLLSEASAPRFSAGGFEFTAPYSSRITTEDWRQNNGIVSVNFKKDDEYIQALLVGASHPEFILDPTPLYAVGFFPDPEEKPLAHPQLQWSDMNSAQNFADAFNRLLYAAYRDEEFAAFRAAAQAWRANPSKPPLSPEADRHRILAENAIKEKNLASAIQHFESALELQPMWPAGWFNLAIIYAEQQDYPDATNRMKHYLELMPDAPDANEARTQMIIWQDKAER